MNPTRIQNGRESEFERRPPEPWCARMDGLTACCPLCSAEVTVRLTKHGRPFFSCGACRSRLFMNSQRAAAHFCSTDKALLRIHSKFTSSLRDNYKKVEAWIHGYKAEEISERQLFSGNPKALAVNQQLRQNATLSLEENIEKAGTCCFLCGWTAEWKPKMKKGWGQFCRFCRTTLFMNTSLALAGLLTRKSCLYQLHQPVGPARHAATANQARPQVRSADSDPPANFPLSGPPAGRSIGRPRTADSPTNAPPSVIQRSSAAPRQPINRLSPT